MEMQKVRVKLLFIELLDGIIYTPIFTRMPDMKALHGLRHNLKTSQEQHITKQVRSVQNYFWNESIYKTTMTIR